MKKKIIAIICILILATAIGIISAKADIKGTNKISPYISEKLKSQNKIDIELYLRNPSTNKYLTETEFNNFKTSLNSGKIAKEIYPEAIILENLSLEEIEELAEREEVEFIAPRLHIALALQDTVEIIGAVPAWEIEINQVPLTGEGQIVFVIDKGVDFSHPDFAGKNVLGGNLDCTISIDCPLIENMPITDPHGTHVAGIVAAQGNINGIAKGANIISAQVFEPGDIYTESVYMKRAINKAVDLAISEGYNIQGITMSIASEETFSDYCDWINNGNNIVKNAINNAAANNITVTIASGNGFNDGAVSYPACMSNAIPVASTQKNGLYAPYSNFNEIVDIFAPGGWVGGSVNSTCLNGSYCSMFGTSMATPHVAGAMAILHQLLELKGITATPSQLEALLFATGDTISNLPNDTWREIDIYKAVQYFIPQCPDCTGDNLVNVQDLIKVIIDWGPCPDIPEPCPADLDKDRTVNVGDIIRVITEWNEICGAQESQFPQPISKEEIKQLENIIKNKLPKEEADKVLSELNKDKNILGNRR